MTRLKIKIIAIGLALATAMTIAFKIESAKSNSWQSLDLDSATLEKMPPQMAIAPTKLPAGTTRRLRGTNQKTVELGVPISDIIAAAYDNSPVRTVFDADMPSNRYDFICTMSKEALQQELKKQFGLIGRHEIRETDALLLQEKYPASGLVPDKNPSGPHSFNAGQGHLSGSNISAQNLAVFLEHQLSVPVIDQTGFGNKGFDLKLTWKDSGDLKQIVANQLGLDLIATNMPLEMLVVQKVK